MLVPVRVIVIGLMSLEVNTGLVQIRGHNLVVSGLLNQDCRCPWNVHNTSQFMPLESGA